MKIILDDTNIKPALYPFTATRHTADIRIGILTIREKWSYFPQLKVFTETPAFLKGDPDDLSFRVEANIIPTRQLVESRMANDISHPNDNFGTIETDEIKILKHPWQIFQYNDWALRQDFELITTARKSQPVSDTNKLINSQEIFLEPGAVVEHSILNAATGPVYIGKNAQVQEGCMIRGPFALCEGAVLKMGSKIYGATTIGPHCVAAGEIKNSVMFGYSNKAHDGYLGDSVIGEWCNLGAGTTNSNVKNTAGEVKVWNNETNDFMTIGLKCGLLMGDYSRSAINTAFNTGTVAGICCNIFGAYFPPKFIDDFSWGTERYAFERVIRDIGNWKKLKAKDITEKEIEILKQLYTQP